MWILIVLSGASCDDPHQFEKIPSRKSGISFGNDIAMTDHFHILDYMYFFNGGGVAVADFDQDGIDDLYFTANQKSSRLYRNLGDLKFEDITNGSATATSGWCTGAAVGDLNQDGYPDLHVCRAASPDPDDRTNLFFLNQGDGTFKEVANLIGIADTSHSTQAAFLDYDRDGDLDIYLLNHAHQYFQTNTPHRRLLRGEAAHTDRLYQNQLRESGELSFTDVSQASGITVEGFGLGVAVSDLNKDGWPDIYVANDFLSSDLMWINQQDGTFQNMLDSVIAHHSYNAMGVAIADLNGDLHSDIFVADMLPVSNEGRKTMAINSNREVEEVLRELGFNTQYARNSLQLGSGIDQSAKLVPYAEVAHQWQVEASDWSWSPLLADFDLDSHQDLFITNGYYRDLTDLDFINYRKRFDRFSSEQFRDSLYLALLSELPEVRKPNRIYKNRKGLFFDCTEEWGLGEATLSNGAAVADLDRDGDLDLIINNINSTCSLYENNSSGQNYLSISLSSTHGLIEGTKIYCHSNDQQQYREAYSISGYQSTSTQIIHFGLGKITYVDSLIVHWPDGSIQVEKSIPANQLLQVRQQDQLLPPHTKPAIHTLLQKGQTQFSSPKTTILFDERRAFPAHLLPYNQPGPAAISADINADGLEDLFVGGDAGRAGAIWLQENNGTFTKQHLDEDVQCIDAAATWIDADSDGHLDLYVVSGGVAHDTLSPHYQDRLYHNDGEGHFHKSTGKIPAISASGGSVAASDYDHDGDTDLFVGGLISIGRYPAPAHSYLLRNEQGHFTDVTQSVAGLSDLGMIAAAEWADIDGDGDDDLICAGHWTSVIIFENKEGQLSRRANSADSTDLIIGFWRSLTSADFDGDGDLDLIAGNQGLNSSFRASISEPLVNYSGYNNGQHWISLSGQWWPDKHGQSTLFPIYERSEFLRIFPEGQNTYPSYREYSNATLSEIILPFPNLAKKVVTTLASCYFENQGNFQFAASPLPSSAQRAPLQDVLITDLNNDDYPDLLGVGNEYGTVGHFERQDANLGFVLLGGAEGWQEMPYQQSGFYMQDDTRKIIQLDIAGHPTILTIHQNGAVTFWKWLLQQQQ